MLYTYAHKYVGTYTYICIYIERERDICVNTMNHAIRVNRSDVQHPIATIYRSAHPLERRRCLRRWSQWRRGFGRRAAGAADTSQAKRLQKAMEHLLTVV